VPGWKAGCRSVTGATVAQASGVTAERSRFDLRCYAAIIDHLIWSLLIQNLGNALRSKTRLD